MAKTVLANTAHIIITKPEGISHNFGVYLKMHESTAEKRAQSATDLLFLASGTTIATNIPNIASPSAELIISGRISPAAAPRKVPRLQPRYGVSIRP